MAVKHGKLIEGYQDGNADPHWFKPIWTNEQTHPEYCEHLNEIDQWCVDQFGTTVGRWYRDGAYFHFAYEIDAVFFKLRWA